ncbi:PepSY-associated TM helix domain-containing protein [Zhongshania sp. BJYM1]|uniref:PepSY-associated TM helix domain-containing protein n=1 Tax=Zhongshania aquatica TaxID=2965069 RepID=UPI0022B5AD21|nr:PepSY-associated TM helix domain-containing protein [Marortus sp. BJYM1]
MDKIAQPHDSSRQRVNARVWFALHGWFAMPVWGGLLLICLTGTLCTISQEITWLYNPQVRSSSAAVDISQFDKVGAAIAMRYPGSHLSSIHIEEPYLAYRVRARLPNGDSKTLFINPHTGRIQGEADGAGFRGFMLALHGWLMFPWQDDHSLGWYLVTIFSIPLLGSLITAVLMIKRFWHLFFQPRIRFHKGRRVLWGDLHRVAGVWSVWFVAVISLSGLWFMLQGILVQNQVDLYPKAPTLERRDMPQLENVQPLDTLPLSQLISKAKAEFPDLRVSYIEMTDHTAGATIIRGKRGASLFRDNVNAVYLNPYSGEVIGTDTPSTVSFLHASAALLTPLHFGDFAGLASKLVWFTFGVILCGIIGSGFYIWYRRTLKTTRHYLTSTRRNRKRGIQPTAWKGFSIISWLILLLPLYFLYRQSYALPNSKQAVTEPPSLTEPQATMVENNTALKN